MDQHLQPADFRRSMAFLPFVGLLTGVLMAGLAFLGSLTSSMIVAATFAVLGGNAFSRGIYLDGLADIADASAFRDRRSKLQSLSHKRVKWRGVVSIILDIVMQTLLCYALIEDMDIWDILRYLPVPAIMGNFSVVFAAYFCRSIAVDDEDYRFIEGTRGRELLIAAFLTALPVFLLLGWQKVLWVFPLAALPSLPFCLIWNHRMKGITRDILGLAHEATVCVSFCLMLFFVFGKRF